MTTDNSEYRRILAHGILFPGECSAQLFRKLDELEDALQPRSHLEQSLILDMTINSWYKIRIARIEDVIFSWQMSEQAALRPKATEPAHAAHACEQIAMNSRCLDMLARWHLRYHKMFRDNFKMFLELRRAIPPPNQEWEEPVPDRGALFYIEPYVEPDTPEPSPAAAPHTPPAEPHTSVARRQYPIERTAPPCFPTPN